MDVKKEMELPKNIKQIGQAPDGQKVYMEDYVVTYLKQILMQEKEMKISILYGRKQMIEDELYWFVSGAIEAETDFFMHKTLLDEEAWGKANDLAKRFFDDTIVLGWAIARTEAQEPLPEQIIRTHKNYFRLDQKLFYEYITDENKEKLFLFEKGKLNQQSGYFVYYDKNECMQNYMVSLRSLERHPEEFEADRAMKQIRENREEKRLQRNRRRTTTALTGFSLILVTTIMIIGITMMNNYEKMESMERVLNQISGKMEQGISNKMTSPMEQKTSTFDLQGQNTEDVYAMNENKMIDNTMDQIPTDDDRKVDDRTIKESEQANIPLSQEETDFTQNEDNMQSDMTENKNRISQEQPENETHEKKDELESEINQKGTQDRKSVV